jgi:signal transduction histidine kinase/ActR/RegA family two-component response regulator
VRPLTDAEPITFSAAKVLGEYLGVNRCAYATVEDDEDAFVLTGNYTNGVGSIVGRYTLTQFGQECLRLMRAGEPYVVSDSETDPRVTMAERPSYVATAIRAVVCVPILKQGKFVAAMAVHSAAPREWERDEVELVQRVASRCWESIERARVTHELRAANRAKDEFLAMLGHELRNPLSPILTALQLMKLRGSDGSERERTVIERQVNHLTRLVDDLLDVSRIAQGKVELKEETVEIAEVVAKAIEITSPLLEQRTHTLDVAVPRRGLFVKGDPTRLTQVMANLINNAAKYTAPGGHISVAARDEGGDVVVRVRDSGIGIAADVLPRVFDLFVQERQAIDRSQGGLGLGLAIVRNLVERHGGRVSAHSDGSGTGCEFVVRLPPAMTNQRLQSPRTSSVGTGSGVAPASDALRILVVDDNVDGADMLATALRGMGYDTRVAHDAPAALRVATDFRPNVAFLDIGLPVIDGYELAARLRERPDANDILLVALTGYGQASDRQKTREAGFDHHLVKPVDLETIDALLSGERDNLNG